MYPIALSKAAASDQAGGKAANLAQAIQLGFKVPEGFVLVRDALRLFLEANQFVPIVQSTLDGYPGMEWHAQMERYEALRAAALDLDIPAAIREQVEPPVLELLNRSGAGVAVRSSSVAEDLEKASFAGIYESFLGVTALASFWQCVKRCWCSLWSPQAVAYAQKMGIRIPMDGMGVLVQRMIPADQSGVAFTADPVTGNPWHFVLNATFGLASKLVDGSAPADRFVLTWDSSQILEKRIERKPSALVCREGTVCEAALPQDKQQFPSLSDEQAEQVRQMALAVDRAFDRRMDLEWAVAGGELYLIQARPLTALPPFFPHELAPEEAEETWTPYLNSYGTMNGRERLIAPFNRNRWLLELWNCYLTPEDIFPHRRGKERDWNGYRYATEWKWETRPQDWERTERWLDENESHLRRDWLAQLARVRQMNARVDQEMKDRSNDPATRTVDWVRLALECKREEYAMQAAVWYAPQWMIFACEALLKRFIEEVMAGAAISGLPAGLLQGLSCFSVERTIAAQALGRDTREAFVREAFEEQPLSQVISFLAQQHPDCIFLRAFTAFCFDYGMEPPAPLGQQDSQELDLGGLLLVYKSSLLGQGADARTVLADGAARREAIEARAREWLYQHRADQVERFDKLLNWAQFWVPALDNRKWHLSIVLRLRRLVRMAKQVLVSEGLIDQPDHFLLLTPEEWSAYCEHPDEEALRSLYRERKHEYERNRRLEPLPYLGKPPGRKLSEPAGQSEMTEGAPESTDANGVWRGEGIAPGKASGIAYRVSNLDRSDYMDRLTDEHILVCGRDAFNAQWRRDWYSLFMVVRGLVTVQGAQLHHATQIARECGVPFVNFPKENLEYLPDGARVEIDGQAGTLRIL